MEFTYSTVVDLALDRTDGLVHGIPLRIHKDAVSEIKGSLRAQQDWSTNVQPVHGYKGGLGEPYSFMRVTVPECIPNRLEIISYANEYAFLYDDAMENLDLSNIESKGPSGMLEAFGSTLLDQDIDGNTLPEKRLQAQILSEMMSIDPERAITTMKAWAAFVQLASRTRDIPFVTLAEYIPARVIDAGERIWFGTLTFAMALTIPSEEYEICMDLARPGYVVLGLTNDLFSWDKEKHAAKQAGQEYVFNAVWVIMREQHVDEDQAKSICADEIRKYADVFCRIVEETKQSKTLSLDVRAYIEAVQFSCSGNLVWSMTCPRYQGFQNSE